MERDRPPRLRPFERIRRVLGHVVNHVDVTVEPYMSSHWKPSAQRDVGKSASRAAEVQVVVEGLRREPFSPFHPTNTTTYTQPKGSFGYTERPDPPPDPPDAA